MASEALRGLSRNRACGRAGSSPGFAVTWPTARWRSLGQVTLLVVADSSSLGGSLADRSAGPSVVDVAAAPAAGIQSRPIAFVPKPLVERLIAIALPMTSRGLVS